MPIAKIQMPDGRVGRFEVPEGTTEQQVMEFASQQSPEPESALTTLVTRPLARAGRMIAGGTLGTASDIGGLIANAPGNLVQLAGKVAGSEAVEGAGKAITPLDDPFSGSRYIKGLIDQATGGLSAPRSGGERIVDDIGEAVAGTGGLIKAAKSLARSPRMFQSAAKSLVDNAAPEGVAAAAAAGAAGFTREAGGGPIAQTIAGLAGGLGGGRFVKGQHTAPETPGLLKDVEGGADSSLATGKVRSTLQSEEAAQKTRVGDLFDEAEILGDDAFVSKGSIKGLSDDIRANRPVDPEGRLLFDSYAERLAEMAVDNHKISLNDLHSLRRELTAAQKTIGSKSHHAGQIKRKLDDMIENANIEGNPDGVGVWKQAIEESKSHRRRFEDPKAIAKAIGDGQIETIERIFFGGGNPARHTEAAGIYDSVLKGVPAEQAREVGFMMRQGVVSRMVKNATDAVDEGDSLSANRLANQIKAIRTRNQSLWSKFPEDEKKMLSDLETALRNKAAGGPLNKLVSFVARFLGGAVRSNIEVPRTLKAKTTMTMEEVIKLLETPAPRPAIGTAVGTTTALEGDL